MGIRKPSGNAPADCEGRDPLEAARAALSLAEQSVQSIESQIAGVTVEIDRLIAIDEQTIEHALAERNSRRRLVRLQDDLTAARASQRQAVAELERAERERLRADLLADRARLNDEATELVRIIRDADILGRHRSFLSRDHANQRALEAIGAYPERNREANALSNVFRNDVERLLEVPDSLDRSAAMIDEKARDEAAQSELRARWHELDCELQRAILDAHDQLAVYPERVRDGARGSGRFAEQVGLPAPKDWLRIATGDLQHLLRIEPPRGAREALLKRLRAEDDERARQERAAAEPCLAGVRLGTPKLGAPVLHQPKYQPPWRRDDPNRSSPPWQRD